MSLLTQTHADLTPDAEARMDHFFNTDDAEPVGQLKAVAKRLNTSIPTLQRHAIMLTAGVKFL